MAMERLFHKTNKRTDWLRWNNGKLNTNLSPEAAVNVERRPATKDVVEAAQHTQNVRTKSCCLFYERMWGNWPLIVADSCLHYLLTLLCDRNLCVHANGVHDLAMDLYGSTIHSIWTWILILLLPILLLLVGGTIELFSISGDCMRTR